VHEGQVWANNQQLQFAIEVLTESAPSAIVDAKGAHLLTKRELSVVQLVAEGLSNRDISHQLRLSEHTVRNYLFRIFNKVGVSTRLELAIYASISEIPGSFIQPPALINSGQGNHPPAKRVASSEAQLVAK
jgi:DNA-binding NarL/FixJ family response regulator